MLLGEEIFPVLVLALELFIGTFHGGFLLLKLANLLFKHLHLVALLEPTADGTLAVLQPLASLLVILRIRGIIVGAATVDDCLLQVLLLLLGQRIVSSLKTGRMITFLARLLLLRVAGLLFFGLLGRGRQFLGYFVLLLLFLGHLFIFAAAALRGNLLEGVVENDSLGCGVPVRAVLHSERRGEATVVGSVVGLANELAGGLLQALNFTIKLIVFACTHAHQRAFVLIDLCFLIYN